MTADTNAMTPEQDGPAPVGEGHAAERALIYQWLAGLLAREPGVEALAAYRSEEGRVLLDGLSEIPSIAPVARNIAQRVEEASEADLRVIALDLAGAFAKLFLGVGGRRAAPPYRSFYTGPDGRLMQEPAIEMQRILQDLEVQMAEGFSELPDHIAVQLSIMASLVESAPRDRQAAYLDAQLLDWIGAFQDRCAMASPSGFYTKVTAAVVEFILEDRAYLAE